MKKIYFAPIIDIVKIRFQQLMDVTSPNGNNMFDPNSTPQDPSGFESRRRRDIWDD